MKKIEINNNVFEIVTKIPQNYKIWNIPLLEQNGSFYIALCEPSEQKYKVNVKTLKAIKLKKEVCELLNDASFYGVRNYNECIKILNSKRKLKSKMLIYRKKLAEKCKDILKELTI